MFLYDSRVLFDHYTTYENQVNSILMNIIHLSPQIYKKVATTHALNPLHPAKHRYMQLFSSTISLLFIPFSVHPDAWPSPVVIPQPCVYFY